MAELHPEMANEAARTALRFVEAESFRSAWWGSDEPWPHRSDLAHALEHAETLASMVLNLADRVSIKKQYLPNPVSRFCTVELKIKPTERFLESCGWTEWDNMLGFRADEPIRVAKIRAKPVLEDSPHVERCVPLAAAGVSKADVRDFWAAQPFDLALPIDYDGTTIDGNCDGCFLKSPHQLVSAMQRNPSMPLWWIAQEDRHGATFTKSGPSYRQMAQFAAEQRNVFDPDQEAIACFCGD